MTYFCRPLHILQPHGNEGGGIGVETFQRVVRWALTGREASLLRREVGDGAGRLLPLFGQQRGLVQAWGRRGAGTTQSV